MKLMEPSDLDAEMRVGHRRRARRPRAERDRRAPVCAAASRCKLAAGIALAVGTDGVRPSRAVFKVTAAIVAVGAAVDGRYLRRDRTTLSKPHAGATRRPRRRGQPGRARRHGRRRPRSTCPRRVAAPALTHAPAANQRRPVAAPVACGRECVHSLKEETALLGGSERGARAAEITKRTQALLEGVRPPGWVRRCCRGAHRDGDSRVLRGRSRRCGARRGAATSTPAGRARRSRRGSTAPARARAPNGADRR